MKTLRIAFHILLWLACIWISAFIGSFLPEAFDHSRGRPEALHWWSWPYTVTAFTFFTSSTFYNFGRIIDILS